MCRKKFSAQKPWVSVCVLRAVRVSEFVLGSVYSCFVVRFYVVCGAFSCWLWCALAMLLGWEDCVKEEGAIPLRRSSIFWFGTVLLGGWSET